MNSPFCTKKEAADFLRRSEDSIDDLRRQGLLRPPLHPGIKQKVLIPKVDLVACEKKLRERRERGAVGMPEQKIKRGVGQYDPSIRYTENEKNC